MLEGVPGPLGSSSGTYRVHASEIARHKVLSCIRVQVLFLDETTQVFELEKRAKGQILLNLVFKHLELSEKDYFSLQYFDSCSSAINNPWRWLDPQKSVKKQLCLRTKTITTLGLPVLHFKVRFWVSDPGKLAEEYTRYLFVLQLRKDILRGTLPAPPTTSALLASYIVQTELGDYNADDHGAHYLSHIQLVPNQIQEIEKKIMELHKLHRGQTPADAEFNYLDHAKRLDLYGVDLHRARDTTNRELHIGVTSSGLLVLQNKIRMNTFSWAKIIKVSFKRKQFFIQLRREVSENYDSVLGFNLGSYKACKALWKSCVEHHTFFRLHTPKPQNKRSALGIGSKFRYSGKTEYQTVEELKKRPVIERTFVRSPSKHFVSSQSIPSLAESTSLKIPSSGSSLRVRSDSSSYKVTSLAGVKAPKMAWGELEKPLNGEANGQLMEEKEVSLPPSVLPQSSTSSSSSSAASSSASSIIIDSAVSPISTQTVGADEGAQGLIIIKMKADESGKFGFNVKGGCDQEQAVLVSRVTPGMPADKCYPRLNEGDQVLFINGKDISHMTHEQVVHLIKNFRDLSAGELILTVKQNVYEPEGLEEPSFQYVPETLPEGVSSAACRLGGRGGALDESMLLLSEGLESGSLIAQFEQLYRRKPGLSVGEARRIENEKKNRYRDISPYDTTRVILTTAPGNYINASYVNMEIPGSGIINRYIACQGPLSQTSADFWFMVWEQQSTLIVMLTTVVEQGRVKCHRYWPHVRESVDFGIIKISCTKEEETIGFAFREFTITNTQTDENRHVSHMQYLAWPDHGVPDDSSEFLGFVGKVREARIGMVEPTIVHCSAGIGRTGVLILMETAQCLIEANEPVYPLDIVRAMRNQRAMMIQTASQYRFVCEAIQRIYSEGLVQPLAEYQMRR